MYVHDVLAQITGNLVLIVFYGGLLGAAAKVISGQHYLYSHVCIYNVCIYRSTYTGSGMLSRFCQLTKDK